MSALTVVRPAFADVLRPSAARVGRFRTAWDVGLIFAGSMLLAASAQVQIPLPLHVGAAPFTMQTLAVLLIGAWLGPIRGAAAVLAYLAEGAAGAPVFAGWSGGAHVFVGPTAGYLYGFVPAALIAGLATTRGLDRRPLAAMAVFAAATLVILACGFGWLTILTGNPKAAFTVGVAPYIGGAVFKTMLAAAIVPVGWSLIGRRK